MKLNDQRTDLTIHPSVQAWFERQGWVPFAFQRACWQRYLEGGSGLLHAPTGMGKSYAAWFGPLLESLNESRQNETIKSAELAAETVSKKVTPKKVAGKKVSKNSGKKKATKKKISTRQTKVIYEPVKVIWLTPLKALASDMALSLTAPLEDAGIQAHLPKPWRVEIRTGDTSSHLKVKQRRELPTALITTPESLSLLLSYPEMQLQLSSVRMVVVDEWHEFMSSKRGVQVELLLAHLRKLVGAPLRSLALSATLGNLDQAADVFLGSKDMTPQTKRIIEGKAQKKIEVDILYPDAIERFPWSGHLGVKLRTQVCDAIDKANTSLLFTNTRAQAEIWFQNLLKDRPDWVDQIALHHGSLEKKKRVIVEEGIKSGDLKAVVCTSSLDLGVDFTPVDQVVQVGSPKGIARLLQRGGRSGHQPGQVSRILCVPTHAFEILEFAAVQEAMQDMNVEARMPIEKPLDVLAQHLVTIAAGSGFDRAAMFEEVRTSHAYRQLTEEEFGWVMDFVCHGGQSLTAYPHFRKVELDEAGQHRVLDKTIAKRHRMHIGTISSDSVITVRYRNGQKLGTVEEYFVSRLQRGQVFTFAGRQLELMRLEGTSVYVKPAGRSSKTVSRWVGTRFPLSTKMAGYVQGKLQLMADYYDSGQSSGIALEASLERIEPMLRLQHEWSLLPTPDLTLSEFTQTKEGAHFFIYPFAGRLVLEGLGAVIGHRLTQITPRTLTITANDYGIEFMSPDPFDLDVSSIKALFSDANLLEDLIACLNSGELSKRYFRDIARIAGLVQPGYPGEQVRTRHLQASSNLFYEVFEEFEPDNLLLNQARREVLDQEFELNRLRQTMKAIQNKPLQLMHCERLSPMAFPLWADSLRSEMVSSEKWQDRVNRMLSELEAAGGVSGSQAGGEHVSL